MWYGSLEFADLLMNSVASRKLLNEHSILHKTLTVREVLLQLSHDVIFNNMQSYKTLLGPVLVK